MVGEVKLFGAAGLQYSSQYHPEGFMAKYSFEVNGRSVTVDSWDPGQPLLYLLRNALGLHGPKFGCGLAQCGACTVLLDGRATRSCITPVKQVAGHNVTTIEGLGSAEKPDAVQAAFIAEQAAQCGYCTNGMIMTAKALLARNPRPTREQVQQGLAGNLCRCGTHTRILAAVLRAAKA
jgi:nicotinate dehydrogenase subunit A